jgi:MscS family membrane protein
LAVKATGPDAKGAFAMMKRVMHHRPSKRKTFIPLVIFSALGFLLSFSHAALGAPPPAPPADPLGRTNPRSSVTGFLESTHSNNYDRAAQFLDLREIPARSRESKGVELARELEQILNSASHFNALELSQSPEGNLTDDPNPNIEHVTAVKAGDTDFTLTLERIQEQPSGPQVWVFSRSTVAAIPKLTPVTTESTIAAHLPNFLVAYEVLETPLWKWIALLLLAALVVLLFRQVAHLVLLSMRNVVQRVARHRWRWLEATVQPLLVFLSAVLFSVAEEFINPSALSRLYIGRAILLIVIASFAWGLINLVELFLARVDTLLDPRQRVVSHSLIYLGRRASRVIIAILAAILVLNNWGFNMTTIIAGLGVGGIAVALAAQQTIANVFGGVSVISDHPVMVGDFGNFAGLQGTVEDIGMRSTRIRTLSRTIVSIPNSNFASMNLENFSLRDKILFNPTLQIKRVTDKDQMTRCMASIEDLLKTDKRIEIGPSPLRISGLSAASYALEIFAYVLTPDIDHFYKIQADLFFNINEALSAHGIELV